MSALPTASGSARTALALAALLLGGCAAPEAWRVAPSYRITHAVPVGAQGYAALARRYEGERRWGDALAAWQKAALAAPADADILDGLGVAQAGQGRFDEAVATLRRAAALAPPSARRHNNLGYALMLAGRDSEARLALRDALALEPGHAMANANLRRLEPAPAPPAPAAAVALVDVPAAAVIAPALQTEPNAAPLPHATAAAPQAPSQPMPSAPPPSLDSLRVEIANGNGVTGMAARVGSWLQQRGLRQRVRLTNLRPFDQPATVVYYRDGFAAEARELARRMPRSVELAPVEGRGLRSDVRVVLGHDLRDVALCEPDCRGAGSVLAAAAGPAMR